MLSAAYTLRPTRSWATLLRDALLVFAGAAFVAVCSQIALPLPFTPVPLTGQTLGVLLVAALLGSRRGSLSMLLYLGEGLAGLPVFQGGHSGVLYALGPTGGYLAGFVAAACVIGWLAEHGWGRHPIRLGLALAAGTVVVYAFGAAWLATLLSLSIDRALGLGVLPFLPGDVFKAAMVAIALPSGQSLLERVRL